MKELWKNGVVVLLIIGSLYIIFLRECERAEPCPPEGQVLVSQQTWDQVMALAQKPPVVKRDTIYLKGDTVFIEVPIPIPTPDPQDPEINHYVDSLIRDDIDVRVKFTIRGELLNRTWDYRPVITILREDSIIYVPNVIIEEKVVQISSNSLYLSLLSGGNSNTFLFGGGIDYITKNNTQIGYIFQRYGNENFHSVRLGVRLFSW